MSIKNEQQFQTILLETTLGIYLQTPRMNSVVFFWARQKVF